MGRERTFTPNVIHHEAYSDLELGGRTLEAIQYTDTVINTLHERGVAKPGHVAGIYSINENGIQVDIHRKGNQGPTGDKYLYQRLEVRFRQPTQLVAGLPFLQSITLQLDPKEMPDSIAHLGHIMTMSSKSPDSPALPSSNTDYDLALVDGLNVFMADLVRSTEGRTPFIPQNIDLDQLQFGL